MGRPKRTDKEQRETTSSSHNLPQPTHSPTLTTSSQTASGVFTENSDTWSGHTVDDGTVDQALGGVHYLESFDFALQDTTLENNSLDMPPEHYLDPTLDMSLDPSIPALVDEGAVAIDTATAVNVNVSVYSRSPPMRQESTHELSNLNVQLYRQLCVVGPMANSYKNSIHSSLVTPPDGNHTLSDAVVFMMNGLQTYHRLLVEILEYTGPTGPTQDAMDDSHDSNPKLGMTSLLSPADGTTDSDDPRCSPTCEEGASAAAVGRQQPRKTIRALLDMPTSLLLLSCHTNLIYLCRDAFSAIRAALLATHRQITLFTLSFLHIDEVSIPQDPDLQIIVLTQAVIRQIDRIGRLLGYPDDGEADSGSKRFGAKVHSNAIPPKLLDLVLTREASGGGPTDRVGMEALREEIRKLHDLVFQPV